MKRYYQPEKFSGETGDLFEFQQIGQIDTQNPEYQKSLRILRAAEAASGMANDYVRFKSALKLAKEYQPYDPTNPDKPFARDIRIALQDALGLTAEEEMDRVKFYTAARSPLDLFHGVDAFVEYTDESGNTARATFDLTLNPNKMAYKSDIIISGEDIPDASADKKAYLQYMDSVARQIIAKMIVKQLHEHKKVIFPNASPETKA
ncbi:MAG: hypothetical protein KGI60_01845 [Patescibacteria group bacterium]|nr:hypothetical protein [Patescibacteria group bacterium]